MPRVVPSSDPNYPRSNNHTRSVRRFPHGCSQHRQGDGEPRQVVRTRRMGAAAARGLRGALRTRRRQPRFARRCPRRASGRGRRHAERLHSRGFLHHAVWRARRVERHRRLSQAPRLARIGARQALSGGAQGLHRVPLRGCRYRSRSAHDGARPHPRRRCGEGRGEARLGRGGALGPSGGARRRGEREERALVHGHDPTPTPASKPPPSVPSPSARIRCARSNPS